jgi:uncharacterized membrane protein YhaH (DUF805 family)
VLKLVLKHSRSGFIAAGLFLLLFLVLLAWMFFIASKNPADSGESGILLLPFAMPWVALVPQVWLGPLVGFASVLVNTLIIYLLFGGLRLKRT